MDDRENAAIEVVDMLGTRLDALFTLGIFYIVKNTALGFIAFS